jgi:hypothetical protein
MTDKVYHVPPHNDNVLTTTFDDMSELNERIEEHFDRLASLLDIISTHEHLKEATGLVLHHYFSIMEEELMRLHTLYQALIGLQKTWLKERKAETAVPTASPPPVKEHKKSAIVIPMSPDTAPLDKG